MWGRARVEGACDATSRGTQNRKIGSREMNSKMVVVVVGPSFKNASQIVSRPRDKITPAVRVIARRLRDINCLAAMFAPRHPDVSSGPLGRGSWGGLARAANPCKSEKNYRATTKGQNRFSTFSHFFTLFRTFTRFSEIFLHDFALN